MSRRRRAVATTITPPSVRQSIRHSPQSLTYHTCAREKSRFLQAAAAAAAAGNSKRYSRPSAISIASP